MAWSQDALAFYSQSTLRDTRAIIPLLVIFGALATRRIIAERTPKDAVPDARQLAGRGVQVACAALVISVFVFQLIVPAGREARHMIPIIAPLLVLAAAGLKFFHSPLSRGKEDKRLARWLVPLGATVCVLVSVQGIFDRPPLGGTSGLQPLAKYVILDAAPKPVLVSSDATGEGMFIAEVARWDLRRPFFRVARTSKALASSEWSGSGYKPKFSDDATLLKHLQSTYSALVLDPSMPPAKRQPHHDHLDRIVAANPAAFTQIATSPITRSGKTNPAPAQLLRVNPGQD